MGEFDKGGRVFEMMQDFWKLMKSYFFIPVDKLQTELFWDGMIIDTETFSKKHTTVNDRFAIELVLLLIKHAEDQDRGKGTLCDNRSDHPAEAVFRVLLKLKEEREDKA